MKTADNLKRALEYCEKQMRCIWGDDTLSRDYQEIHRQWAIETAKKAITEYEADKTMLETKP